MPKYTKALFLLLLPVSFICLSFTLQLNTFKAGQLTYERVREAYKAKMSYLQELYFAKHISLANHEIFFRAFKQERELEVWVKNIKSDTFTLLKTYKFCHASGCLGPKRQCGDKQVPEGFYNIDRFNPSSDYYLSLGINYPNASDRILGNKENTGGDIFIHGSCVSVGCIAMTDDYIKEIYVAAVEARNAGQKNIPVHIFPYRFSDANTLVASNTTSQEFWNNLKTGYDYFNETKKIPSFSIDDHGRYIFETSNIVYK